MSRFTELKNQRQAYVTISEMAKKFDPEEVEVVYKHDGNRDNDGRFIYSPRGNDIAIIPQRWNGSRVSIDADEVPALIKALREFFE
jgi:hypothetical protein